MSYLYCLYLQFSTILVSSNFHFHCSKLNYVLYITLFTDWKHSVYISYLSSSFVLFFLISLFFPASLHPSRLPTVFLSVSCLESQPMGQPRARKFVSGSVVEREAHQRSHGAFFSLRTRGCCFRHVLFRETTSLGTCVGLRGVAFSVTPVFDEDFLYNEVGVPVIQKVHSNQLSVQTRKSQVTYVCICLLAKTLVHDP